MEGGGPGVVAERREQRAAERRGRTLGHWDTGTATGQQLDAGGRSSQPVADGTTLPGPGAVRGHVTKPPPPPPQQIVTLFQTPESRSCEDDAGGAGGVPPGDGGRAAQGQLLDRRLAGVHQEDARPLRGGQCNSLD